jgi:hypothetical protein
MLLDSLKDIVKHTHSLGFIEMVKLVGTDKDAKIEAIDADKTVVLYGEMYQPLKEIESTIGLSRLAQLKGFMELHGGSTVSVELETRGSASVPTELKFDDGEGDVASYRFMGETIANEQIKVPPFKGAVWNVTIKPEKAKIDRLKQYEGVLGGFEKRFIVSTKGDVLNFSIGSGPTDRSNLPFAKGITGTLKHQWSWPLSQVLSIIKLNDTGDVTMHFSDMGALKIDVDSGIGKYSYILPATKT